MSEFNPEKISVEFRDDAKLTEPVIPRYYTLTHSDVTGELFLTIGFQYAYDKVNEMNDEVLGKWFKNDNGFSFYVCVSIDDKSDPSLAAVRNKIFRRELPLALKAIRYGDREFFNSNPELDNQPIIIYFISDNPEFNKIEYWGVFSDYNSSL